MSDAAVESQGWLCIMCGYVYEPDFGDPTQGVDPGTPFGDLPEDWVCPLCFVEKSEFEPC